MSIRSIDLMVLYSKASDVEKLQQSSQQAPQIAQQQLAAEELQKNEIKRAQVAGANKTEGSKVGRKKDDEGGKRPTYGHNLKQQRDEDAQAEENKKKKGEHVAKPSIDIRI